MGFIFFFFYCRSLQQQLTSIFFSLSVSRFQFYLPSSKEVTIVSLCDVKEPPTKKLKLSQDVSQANDSLETVVDGLQSNKPILKEQVIIWLDAIQK